MTNQQASDVLREYIRTNRPCNGLEMALQKAITALEHQPEPQTQEPSIFGKIAGELLGGKGAQQAEPKPYGVQCENCGTEQPKHHTVCFKCGSPNLRPLYDDCVQCWTRRRP